MVSSHNKDSREGDRAEDERCGVWKKLLRGKLTIYISACRERTQMIKTMQPRPPPSPTGRGILMPRWISITRHNWILTGECSFGCSKVGAGGPVAGGLIGHSASVVVWGRVWSLRGWRIRLLAGSRTCSSRAHIWLGRGPRGESTQVCLFNGPVIWLKLFIILYSLQ